MSALDTETRWLEALEPLRKSRMTFIITHRCEQRLHEIDRSSCSNMCNMSDMGPGGREIVVEGPADLVPNSAYIRY